jgi:hypothetical protein
MPVFTVGTYDLGSNNQLNLLAAINTQNSTSYTLAEYGFTEPKRVTIPTPQFNTSIKLGPRAATGKIGFKTIYYNRIHVDDIGVLTITWQNELFLTELLNRLSEKYGIPLSPNDVFEQRIIPPVAPETDISLTLNFKDSSIAYYGGGAIILGQNDPALEFESPLTMPFKNDLVFYVNNFYKTKTNNNYLESSILGIANDKIRSRTLTVTNLDTTDYASIVKNTYTDAQRSKLEQLLPFVFTWTVGETKIIRGVTIYGDIAEINETSNYVDKIGSLYALNPLISAEITVARTKILVREGTRDRNGNIYILVGDPLLNKVKLLRSSDDGLNFNEVIVTITNMASFNYGVWENVTIHDMLVANNKLYVLVTNPVTYGVHPGKASSGPAVEEFNLSTGVSNYYPLFNQGNVINSGLSLVFNPASKLRFVSTETEVTEIDVIGIARTAHTLEPVIVYFNKPTGLEYIPEILPINVLDYPIYGIAAYSKPMVKDPLGSFVSVEILTMVPTSVKNDFFLIETNERLENSSLGYGVITISGIRKGSQIGGWIENVLDLGGGSEPMFVTVVDNGKRNHYVFCGSNGIYHTQYIEENPNEYTPTLLKVFDVGSHTGFDLECDIGNGNYFSPVVEENPNFSVIFRNYPNEESLKLPIGYSFIVKNKVTTEDMWLTSANSISALQERVFGEEYSFLGKIPVAVFSDNTGNIYAWTKYQGIYVSSDKGNSWKDYAAVKSYYSNSKYLGRSSIPLKPLDFKAMNIIGSIAYAEVNVKRDVYVFNTETNENNFYVNLKDDVVYRVDGTKPAGDIVLNTVYLTTSLNSTSDFSPRKVIGWDTDVANNIRALTRYSEAGVAKQLNQLGFPDALADDALDVYSDVVFLGLKAVVITNSNSNGYNLCLVKLDDSFTTVGLKYSAVPKFASFTPVAIQPLWDGNVPGLPYTPIIITSTSKDILVLERDGVGGTPTTVNSISLVIPGDTGKVLQWFGMFSSNRRDRFVFQEGNGIFKLVYSYNSGTSKSVITLVKVFDTSTLNVEYVYSGSQYNLPLVAPYSDTLIDAWPIQGTVLGVDCLGFDKREKLADGYGSYYWHVSVVNSVDCSYVAPVPSDTGPGGANLNVGP